MRRQEVKTTARMLHHETRCNYTTDLPIKAQNLLEGEVLGSRQTWHGNNVHQWSVLKTWLSKHSLGVNICTLTVAWVGSLEDKTKLFVKVEHSIAHKQCLLLLLIKSKKEEQTDVHNIKMVVFWKGRISGEKALYAYYSDGSLACVHAI